jgi:glucose-1-phosphate thymidylyltransferase
MKGIILAGGYATRLHPLTEHQPKHLLPIVNRPMLEYLLDELEPLEIDHYYLVTNAKFAQRFTDWTTTLKPEWRKKITVVNDGTTSNEDRLGSLGDILFTIDKFNIQDDLFIIGADNLTDFAFQRLLDTFNEHKQPVVGVYDVKDIHLAKQFGVIEVNDLGVIASFEEKPEKPKSSLISTLFYILPIETFPIIVECVACGKADKAGNLIEALVARGHVYVVSHDGHWFDIGTHETYEQAKEFFTIKHG